MQTFVIAVIAVVAFLAGMLLLDLTYDREIPYDKPYHKDILLSMISNCQRVNNQKCTLRSVYSKEVNKLVWVVDIKTEDN